MICFSLNLLHFILVRLLNGPDFTRPWRKSRGSDQLTSSRAEQPRIEATAISRISEGKCCLQYRSRMAWWRQTASGLGKMPLFV
jgi:hypothetical protein